MRIAVLGATEQVEGFSLAGALVLAAGDTEDLDRAWDALPDDVGVLVLTPRAWDRLHGRFDERPQLLTTMSPP